MSEPRYTRQARLEEVGEDGQARLACAEACIAGGGLAGAVAARYAAGAGFGALRISSEPAARAARAVDARVRTVTDPGMAQEVAPAWLDGLDPAARAVAAGAHEALVAIVRRLAR